MAGKVTNHLGDLHEDLTNARIYDERNIGQIVASLQEVGFSRSIVIDENNKILAGNGVTEAAAIVGIENVKVIEADGKTIIAVRRTGLSEEQKKRLALWDNRAAETATWNLDQLKIEFEAGNLQGMFSNTELLTLGVIDDSDEGIPAPHIDRREELKAKYGTEVGQIWRLGHHRLIIGNSENLQTVQNFHAVANLCFTSPPYWVGKSYETQKTIEEIDYFVINVSNVISTVVMKDASRIVINTGTGIGTTMDKRKKRLVLLLMDKWANALYDLGWNMRHLRHWIKTGSMMATSANSDMIDQHCEFIGTFENDEGEDLKWNDNIEDDVMLLETYFHHKGLYRGRNRVNGTWVMKGYWDDIKGNANSDSHEAAFPPQLVLRHILLYTKMNEVVFDPFSGTGTTMVSCEKLKRSCLAIELDPGYAAVSIERWVEMTNEVPELEI